MVRQLEHQLELFQIFLALATMSMLRGTNCNLTLISQNILARSCDDVTFHLMILMQQYFDNQEVITFVTNNIETTKYDVDVYDCIIARLDKPIIKFYNVEDMLSRQPLLEPNFLETPKTREGYAIVADSYDEMANDIVTLAEINPTAKFIFIITDGNVEEGEHILRMAWDSYQMSRILIAMPVLIETTYKLQVMLYNPFEFADVNCTIRGKYYEFTIDSSNYMNQYAEIVDIITNQYTNLYNYPVRVYMFEWPSLAMAIRNPLNMREILRFRLLDGELLYILSTHMNFKTEFIGNIKQHTIAGSIHAVDEGKADISFNSRIIADLGVNNTVFLTPVYLIQLKYILPKKYSTKILNVFIYGMFDWDVELIMVAVFLILIIMWYLLNYFYERFTHKSEANSIPRALLIVTSTQQFISIKFTKFLKGHQQILLGSMLIYGIVVSSNFQSTVVKQLATELEDRDINTIRQLVDSSYDIKYLSAYYDSVKLPANISKKSTVYRLYKKQTRLYSSFEDSIKLVVSNKSLAILCSMLVAEEIKSQYLDPKTGRPLVHILRETLAEFYNSYIVPKSSPYRMRMNQILRRTNEGGIVSHEKAQIEWKTQLNYLRAIKEHRLFITYDKSDKGVSIEQIRGLFVVWSSLLTFACFVFVIELSVYYLYPQYQRTKVSRQ